MPGGLPSAVHPLWGQAGHVAQVALGEAHDLAADGAPPPPDVLGKYRSAHQNPLGVALQDSILNVHQTGLSSLLQRDVSLGTPPKKSGGQVGVTDGPWRHDHHSCRDRRALHNNGARNCKTLDAIATSNMFTVAKVMIAPLLRLHPLP